MADDIKEVLYGKTERVVLADGKEYVMREPNLETMVEIDFDLAKIEDMKNIKKLVWAMLKDDNPSLNEKTMARLITISMLGEGSSLLKAVANLIGRGEASKN